MSYFIANFSPKRLVQYHFLITNTATKANYLKAKKICALQEKKGKTDSGKKSRESNSQKEKHALFYHYVSKIS